MIVIAGTARVRSDKRAAAEDAAARVAAATRQEPGNCAYRFGWDVDDDNVVHIFEEWEDDDALASHFGTPHLAEFTAVLAEVLDGAPELHRYEISEKGNLTG